MTSAAAHQARQLEQERLDLEKAAYRVGTMLYSTVQSGENKLKSHRTPEACAAGVNMLFGVELVSGYSLREGVKKGRVGKSPQRRGAPSILPEEDLKDIAFAVFTACSIEQANSEKQLDRQQLISLVGEGVNEKRRADSDPEINERTLYRNIEKRNCSRQNLSPDDPREARRVLWLNYQSMCKHYTRWEEFVVKYGFARLAADDAERNRFGNVVFHPQKTGHMGNYDEFNFSLDGDGQSASGRPGNVPNNPSLPSSGYAEDKSSRRVTVCCGVTFDDEALPPLFIFPSKAQPENMKIAHAHIEKFPQIRGQFGYSEPRFFDCEIAFSENGSMTTQLHREYYRRLIKRLYPYAAPTDGNWVCFKADSGPGRDDDEFLADTANDGIGFFPGLPNGTEVGQECDQLFGKLKGIGEDNQKKLFLARRRVEGENVSLTFGDIAYIIFGGDVVLTDGETVNLRNAFEEAFSRERIQRAREKTGYCPATRAALASDRIRHEIVENHDGEIDEDADPYGSILEVLENNNHHVTSSLAQRGYRHLSSDLRRCIKRVTANQVGGRESTVTVPGSRARQDLLATCTSAGQFFRITDGGGMANQHDALIGKVRLQMKADAEKLLKRREKILQWEGYMERMQELDVTNSSSWGVPHYQAAILSKQGPYPPNDEKVKSMRKSDLRRLWQSKYESADFPDIEWTDEDEDELQRLLEGDVENLDESGLMKEAWDREQEYMTTRLADALPHHKRKAIMLDLWTRLSDEHRHDLKTALSELEDEGAHERDNTNSGLGDGHSSFTLDEESNDHDERSQAETSSLEIVEDSSQSDDSEDASQCGGHGW